MHTATAIKGYKILVLGGCARAGRCLDDLWEWDVTAYKWQQVYVSVRQLTSAYVCLANVWEWDVTAAGIRQHTSAYVRIRQHTSEYVCLADFVGVSHASAYKWQQVQRRGWGPVFGQTYADVC